MILNIVADPVGAGIVRSLESSGGSIAGVNATISRLPKVTSPEAVKERATVVEC